MSKTIEYPIAEGYVSNWGLKEALRELVANAIDQGNFSLGLKGTELTITNKDTVLSPETLLLGNSSKTKDENSIGQYGEGLKLAMLVLCRLGHEVKIFNGRWENWTPLIGTSDNFKARVLKLKTREVSGKRENDFVVNVSNISRQVYDELHDMFLQLMPCHKKISTYYGDLLQESLFVNKIYCKGVYVCEAKNFAYGYNFKDLDIGRDRRTPSSWEIDQMVVYIWELLIKQKAVSNKILYELFTLEKKEAEAFKGYLAENIHKSVLEEYINTHGDKVPVLSLGQQEELTKLGVESTVVSKPLAEILHKKLDSIEAVKAKKALEYEETTDYLKETYEKLLDIFVNALNGKPENLVIVKFKNPNTKGYSKDDKILISNQCLDDFGEAILELINKVGRNDELIIKVFNYMFNNNHRR